MLRIIVGFALMGIGFFSVVTFNPFAGNGLIEVAGGFALAFAGMAMVITSKTFQEL